MTEAVPPSPWARASAPDTEAASPNGTQPPASPPPMPGPARGYPLAYDPPPVPERHPADPEETPSTKAWAVLALGVVGVVLMFCGGGLVPGLAALVLARPARAELRASAGFLTGQRSLRAGEILSWTAIVVSSVVIVSVVIGLLIGSVGHGPRYGVNIN